MEKARILIVEDEGLVALDLQRRLENQGYQIVAVVQSGEEALRRIAAARPDLVLMDIQLKGEMDGIEAAEQIRQQFHLPVIYLSALADQDSLPRVRETAAYGFLLKPYEENELRINIELALAKHQLERRLSEREELFRQLAESIDIAFWLYDLRQDALLYVSPSYQQVTGQPGERLQQDPSFWLETVDPADADRVENAFDQHLRGAAQFDEEYRVVQPDGSTRWNWARLSWVRDEAGAIYRVGAIVKDITGRKIAEAELIYKTLHDGLTGLPNRALFMDRLAHTVERARRNPGALSAILFLDLDGFKAMNDNFGHAGGDEFLIAMAHRLSACLRPVDTVARFGGDEFAILVEDIQNAGQAFQVAERVQREISVPYELHGQPVATTASIGIVLTSAENIQPEELLRNADIAMYRAKTHGKARYEFYP